MTVLDFGKTVSFYKHLISILGKEVYILPLLPDESGNSDDVCEFEERRGWWAI